MFTKTGGCSMHRQERMRTMKRILIITVLAVLLTSTAGATAAMAAPTGNAAVRQFDVEIEGGGTGRLTINPAQQTFVCNGAGAMPGQMYYLSIWFDDGTPSAVTIELGATAAKADGSIHMTGQCTATMTQLDEQSPRVNIGPRVGGGVYQPIIGLDLENKGAFVAKIACYYSTDEGVTWHESDHSSGILTGMIGSVYIKSLNVPDGALVKIHAIVVAGKDRTGSQVYRYQEVEWPRNWAMYNITGTTLNPTLHYVNYW